MAYHDYVRRHPHDINDDDDDGATTLLVASMRYVFNTRRVDHTR